MLIASHILFWPVVHSFASWPVPLTCSSTNFLANPCDLRARSRVLAGLQVSAQAARASAGWGSRSSQTRRSGGGWTGPSGAIGFRVGRVGAVDAWVPVLNCIQKLIRHLVLGKKQQTRCNIFWANRPFVTPGICSMGKPAEVVQIFWADLPSLMRFACGPMRFNAQVGCLGGGFLELGPRRAQQQRTG